MSAKASDAPRSKVGSVQGERSRQMGEEIRTLRKCSDLHQGRAKAVLKWRCGRSAWGELVQSVNITDSNREAQAYHVIISHTSTALGSKSSAYSRIYVSQL
jgi:hypothetical protein